MAFTVHIQSEGLFIATESTRERINSIKNIQSQAHPPPVTPDSRAGLVSTSIVSHLMFVGSK